MAAPAQPLDEHIGDGRNILDNQNFRHARAPGGPRGCAAPAALTQLQDVRSAPAAYPAFSIKLFAAARASRVISAPASMRAISSRRSRGAERATRVATRRRRRLVLDDPEVALRARGDLRRVRDRQHLRARGKPRQPLADGVGDRAADARVDFVEHQRRRGVTLRQRHFQRQQKPRQLAARGDLHQRPRPRAGIGLHDELDAVVAVGGDQRRVAVDLGGKARALELQRRQLGVDGAGESLGAPRRRALDRARARRRRIAPAPPRARIVRAERRARGLRRGRRARRRIFPPAPAARRRRRRICAPCRAARTAAPRSAPVRADRSRRRATPPRPTARRVRAPPSPRRAP